jgi:uncharacterized membrane protein
VPRGTRLLAAILRDAGRQYRRRPLAVVLTLALEIAALPLEEEGDAIQGAAGILLLVVAILVELFLVAYLAGALSPTPSPAGEAVTAARRAIGPGVRGMLLLYLYVAVAFLIAMLLFGGDQGTPLSSGEQRNFLVGAAPLVAVAFAFLAVLSQRVVLDGERRALRAAAASHRVAAAHFPICLLIGVLQALGLTLGAFDPGGFLAVVVAVGLGLLDPFPVAMSNSLYLQTRSLIDSGGSPK